MSSHSIFSAQRVAIWATAAVLLASLAPGVPAHATTSIDLGVAQNFSILAGSDFTDGLSTQLLGTAQKKVGIAPGSVTSGATMGVGLTPINNNDAEAIAAQRDLESAWAAIGALPASLIGGELGGQTLGPGVYQSGATALTMTTNLNLDANNDPSAIFVIKSGAALTTTASTQVNLLRGAQGANVYWLVPAAVGFGAGTKFVGHILAGAAFTSGADSTLDGQVLARASAPVTLGARTVITHDIALHSYSVEYSANGGSGSMAAQSGTGVSVTLPLNSFTKAGSSFAGWNTSADGSGTAYADGAVVAVSVDVTRTFYAQWTLVGFAYTNTFSANAGSGSMAALSGTGVSVTLPLNSFTKAGSSFAGWNTSADGSGTAYADGAVVAVSVDVTRTLYAQWRMVIGNAPIAPPSRTNTFDKNGGAGVMDNQTWTTVNVNLSKNTFTRVNFVFKGWNSASNGAGVAYLPGALFSSTPTLSTVFYAQWQPIVFNASQVLFSPGSWSLGGAAKAGLRKFISLHKGVIALRISVVGYAASYPKGSATALAQRRANSVASFINTYLPRARIATSSGPSAQNQIASNTISGQSVNRRVTFTQY